jgi:hypothetical protein
MVRFLQEAQIELAVIRVTIQTEARTNFLIQKYYVYVVALYPAPRRWNIVIP